MVKYQSKGIVFLSNLAFVTEVIDLLPFYQTHPAPAQINIVEKLQFPMHIHREAELFYQKEGENTVNISGIEHTLKPGELAIAFPNEPHSYDHGEVDRHITLIFDPDFCPDFALVFKHYRPEFPFLDVSDAPPDLRVTLEMLYALCAEGMPDGKLLKGYLSIILFRIMEQLPLLSEENYQKRDLTSKVVSYVMQNYQSPISLDHVAGALGVSKYEISRVFSGKIKMGFNQYLNRMRLEQAVYALVCTELSVTEIAFSCGFESLRTFYRAFSEQYHLSPLAYRKQNLPGNHPSKP